MTLRDKFELLEDIGFKETFNSDWVNTSMFNGMKFEVLERVPISHCRMDGDEPKWKIKILETGDVFDAYPSEIIKGL